MNRMIPAALALACVTAVPALADAVAAQPAPVTSVDLPWGDLVSAVAKPVFDVVTSLIAALIVGLIAKFAPWLSTWVSKVQIEGALGRVEAFGLNATLGAAKGKTLTVDVGSAALANMVQYGANNVKPLVLKAMGGLPGLADKLFRRLSLDETAHAGNVLAPVQAQIASGAIAKSA